MCLNNMLKAFASGLSTNHSYYTVQSNVMNNCLLCRYVETVNCTGRPNTPTGGSRNTGSGNSRHGITVRCGFTFQLWEHIRHSSCASGCSRLVHRWHVTMFVWSAVLAEQFLVLAKVGSVASCILTWLIAPVWLPVIAMLGWDVGLEVGFPSSTVAAWRTGEPMFLMSDHVIVQVH